MARKGLSDEELERLLYESGDDDEFDGVSDDEEELLLSENEQELIENSDQFEDEVDEVPYCDNYCWKQGTFIQKIHAFNNENSGCRLQNFGNNPSYLDCFEIFISEDFIKSVTYQTNLFHSQNEAAGKQESKKMKKWLDVGTEEMYIFIGLSLLMPQVKKLKLCDYWSTDTVLSTPFFGQVMTRDRYFSILSSLHFTDNDTADTNDKLYKIRLVLNHLRTSFQNTFILFKMYVLMKALCCSKADLPSSDTYPRKDIDLE